MIKMNNIKQGFTISGHGHAIQILLDLVREQLHRVLIAEHLLAIAQRLVVDNIVGIAATGAVVLHAALLTEKETRARVRIGAPAHLQLLQLLQRRPINLSVLRLLCNAAPTAIRLDRRVIGRALICDQVALAVANVAIVAARKDLVVQVSHGNTAARLLATVVAVARVQRVQPDRIAHIVIVVVVDEFVAVAIAVLVDGRGLEGAAVLRGAAQVLVLPMPLGHANTAYL